MNIEYTVQIWQEKEQFVAHAMPLDVMSSGATPEQARQALTEAVDLFLTTADEVGTLAEVLEVVIPTYSEVPASIIRSNLKTAEISRDEYFALLEQVR